MEYFAGSDVSLEKAATCIVDGEGRIVREVRAASGPEAGVAFFEACGTTMPRVGLAAWEFTEAGISVICIEAHQAKAPMGGVIRTSPSDFMSFSVPASHDTPD